MPISTSTMLELGTVAPDFTLADSDQKPVALADFQGAPAYLIVFLNIGCPFAESISLEFAKLGEEYQKKSVPVIAIHSQWDWELTVVQDNLRNKNNQWGFTFPYLLDRTQEAARAYRVACTPACYIFDADHKLVYRGQFDDSRPGNDIEVTGKDVRAALDAVLAGKAVSFDQKSAFGCSVYFNPDNKPDFQIDC